MPYTHTTQTNYAMSSLFFSFSFGLHTLQGHIREAKTALDIIILLFYFFNTQPTTLYIPSSLYTPIPITIIRTHLQVLILHSIQFT